MRLLRFAVLGAAASALSTALVALPAVASPAAASAPGACTADVVYLAARGSGEHPLNGDKMWTDTSPTGLSMQGEGTRMFEYGQLLKRAVAAKHLSFVDAGIGVDETAHALTYTADGVEELKPSSGELALLKGYDPTDFWRIYKQGHVDPYLASVASGVAATKAALHHWATKCPNAKIVLAGYSQGAMAIEQAEVDLASSGSIALLSRVAATVLLANPDRAVREATTLIGTGGPGRSGIAAALSIFTGSAPRSSDTENLVDDSDLVGDFNLFGAISHNSLKTISQHSWSEIRKAFKADAAVHSNNYANVKDVVPFGTKDKQTGIYYGTTLVAGVSFANHRLTSVASPTITKANLVDGGVALAFAPATNPAAGAPLYYQCEVSPDAGSTVYTCNGGDNGVLGSFPLTSPQTVPSSIYLGSGFAYVQPGWSVRMWAVTEAGPGPKSAWYTIDQPLQAPSLQTAAVGSQGLTLTFSTPPPAPGLTIRYYQCEVSPDAGSTVYTCNGGDNGVLGSFPLTSPQTVPSSIYLGSGFAYVQPGWSVRMWAVTDPVQSPKTAWVTVT